MESIMYYVYVKSDEQGRLIAIDSSAFLRHVEDWEMIDYGYGDRFHHAQGNYLPLPIMDERGVYRYKLDNGLPIERTREEMDADYVPPAHVPGDAERIARLEEELKAAKILLGLEA